MNILLHVEPCEEELAQISRPLFSKRQRFVRKSHMHPPAGIDDVGIIGHDDIHEKDPLQGSEAFRIFWVHGQLSASLRSQCGAW